MPSTRKKRIQRNKNQKKKKAGDRKNVVSTTLVPESLEAKSKEVLPRTRPPPTLDREELLRRLHQRTCALECRRTGKTQKEAKEAADKMGFSNKDAMQLMSKLRKKHPDLEQRVKNGESMENVLAGMLSQSKSAPADDLAWTEDSDTEEDDEEGDGDLVPLDEPVSPGLESDLMPDLVSDSSSDSD
jgi:hypothetical protein